jgi:hypothetical protein
LKRWADLSQGDEMQIMNGDHAQFEIDHANTPKEERPDWPLPSFDAQDWAKAFCKLNPSADYGTMLAWFSGALMRGFDEASSRYAPKRPWWRRLF